MRTTAWILAGVLIGLAVPAAAAGTVFEMVGKNSAGQTIARSRMFIAGTWLRIDSETTAGGDFRKSMIFRSDRGGMLVLDHSKSEALRIKRKTVEEQLEAAAPVEIRRTSETGTTNGFPWVKYDVVREESTIREYLVTDRSKLDIDDSTFEVFQEMARFFDEVARGLGTGFENPFDGAGSLDGFPVVTREFSGAEPGTETEPVKKLDPPTSR